MLFNSLKIYEPEIILWLYSKTEPKKAFDFCFDEGILRQYFEFDKMYNEYIEGKANEHNASVIEYSLVEGSLPPGSKSTPSYLQRIGQSIFHASLQLKSFVKSNVPLCPHSHSYSAVVQSSETDNILVVSLPHSGQNFPVATFPHLHVQLPAAGDCPAKEVCRSYRSE